MAVVIPRRWAAPVGDRSAAIDTENIAPVKPSQSWRAGGSFLVRRWSTPSSTAVANALPEWFAG